MITKVAEINDIVPGEGKSFTVNGQDIAVLKAENGQFYAMENFCPHAGFQMVDAIVQPEDGVVECFAHGATFDLQTGAATSPAHRALKIYPVKVEGNDVLVEIS